VRARFITFEGGEGTGKSTQAKLLARRLQDFGVDTLLTREPGGSPGAEVMRHVLLSGAAKSLGVYAEAILFAAARADHLSRTIQPALTSGKWVLCDRFYDSTRIYQGTLGNVEPGLIAALERATVGEALPHLTLILDLPPEIGLARAAYRRGEETPDRFEGEALEFHRVLRDAYRELPRQHPDRCVLIDATGEPEKVAEAIWRVVEGRFVELQRADAAALASA
jgi:dTMP kinase